MKGIFMKKFTLALAGMMALASPAFAIDYSDRAEQIREEEAEYRAARERVREDQRVIDKYEARLEQNRAEKARAKREGDYGRQASESVAIGANKATIKTREAKRDMDQKMVDKNRRELREARGDYRDRDYRDRDYSDRRYDQMAPSAGMPEFAGSSVFYGSSILSNERDWSNARGWNDARYDARYESNRSSY